MSDEIDKIINDIEAESMAKDREHEQLREALVPAETDTEQMRKERQEKVDEFRLTLDLDDEEEIIADNENTFTDENAPTMEEMAEETAEESEILEKPKKKAEKPKKKKKKSALGGLIYGLVVVLVSVVLALVILAMVLDISGISKSGDKVSVTIPQGATTQQVADILAQKDLIDYPIVFRLYSRLTEADGTYQPHEELDLSADMGYDAIIEALQESKPRESVTVTIPEGYTLKEIAALLEKNNVCTEAEFLKAAIEGDYSDYSFIAAIPKAESDPRYKQRVYRLEGYLFPDTYDFFTNGSAETVIRKMLSNFERRVDTSLLTAIEARGMTIDQAVIMASIIQAEVPSENDMVRVARVLYNRMEKGSPYPRLECDSTQLYLKELVGSYAADSELALAYDTYVIEGLPIGAIGNAGLEAITAVTRPSSEDNVKDCYFFVSNTRTGETFFSKTYNQHIRKCKELGLL